METPLNGPDVGPPTLERIRRAPKVLLHDHLDGGLRPSTIIELADETGYTDLPTTDADELAAWMLRGANRKDLTLYLETFAHTVGVMQTAPAIERVDRDAVMAPAYYMLNCAHPDHFDLTGDANWLSRIGGVRANASRMSHAELDECETLDDGDPQEFGELNQQLRSRLPQLRVIGGCCGIGTEHIVALKAAMPESWLAPPP